MFRSMYFYVNMWYTNCLTFQKHFDIFLHCPDNRKSHNAVSSHRLFARYPPHFQKVQCISQSICALCWNYFVEQKMNSFHLFYYILKEYRFFFLNMSSMPFLPLSEEIFRAEDALNHPTFMWVLCSGSLQYFDYEHQGSVPFTCPECMSLILVTPCALSGQCLVRSWVPLDWLWEY